MLKPTPGIGDVPQSLALAQSCGLHTGGSDSWRLFFFFSADLVTSSAGFTHCSRGNIIFNLADSIDESGRRRRGEVRTIRWNLGRPVWENQYDSRHRGWRRCRHRHRELKDASTSHSGASSPGLNPTWVRSPGLPFRLHSLFGRAGSLADPRDALTLTGGAAPGLQAVRQRLGGGASPVRQPGRKPGNLPFAGETAASGQYEQCGGFFQNPLVD